MPRGPSVEVSGAGAIVVILFIGIILGSVVFYLPISPSISGAFTVQTTGNTAQINILSAVYSKVTLIKGLTARDGTLSLTTKPAQIGQYDLTIEVRYGSLSDFLAGSLQPILTYSYGNAGDGTYGFEVLFLYRQESQGVPYIITVHLTGPSLYQPVVVSVLVSTS